MGALDEGHFNGELENGVKIKRCFKVEEKESEAISAIKHAVKDLLEGLGEDSNREGIRKTPLRVAKALLDGTRGYRQEVRDIVQGALFPEAGLDSAVGHAGGVGGLVIVRDLNLFSICESCLLPFQVKCQVGYVPSEERVVGLSKLSRVADVFAKRLQNPQRLADEVCLGLHNGIKPAGVAVVLQCWHIHSPEVEVCCTNPYFHPSKVEMQGWEKLLVSSGSGVLEKEKGDVWFDFLSLLKLNGIDVEKAIKQPSQRWCPSKPLDAFCNGHLSNGHSSNGHLSNGHLSNGHLSNGHLSNGHSSPRNPSVHRVSSKTEPSPPAMINAVYEMIRSLGEDPSRKELIGTPHRFVQWLMKYKKCNFEMKLNGIDPGRNLCSDINAANISHDQDEIWSELNFPLWSLCEHHLLPFHGVVHIGYFHSKGAEPIKRNVLQSIVHFHGCKLQVQERLSRQIAETVSSVLGGDVMVVVEANHICMVSRGIEKVGSSTATTAILGRFSTDRASRDKFLDTIKNSTASGGR